MRNADKTIEAIRVARAAVELELERHRVGDGRVGTIAQLVTIERQLREWESEASAGVIQPRETRDQGMGRMITDEWPLGSSLGKLVLIAEQSYLTL